MNADCGGNPRLDSGARPDGEILAGATIVECSAFVAAPMAGLVLGQLGAAVIKCDPPGGPIDRGRYPRADSGTSFFWHGLNRGKKSVLVDSRSPAGQDLLQRLITAPGPGGGMLLTNLPERGWNGYDALRSVREDVIVVRILGDFDGRGAVDYTVAAATGIPWLTGAEQAAGPVNSVLPTWDIATGMMAAAAVIGALYRRRQTGEGAHLTLALSDVAVWGLSALGWLDHARATGQGRPRIGNDLYGGFGRDFATADDAQVMVVALSVAQWRRLVAATGLAGDVRRLEESTGRSLDDEGARYDLRARIAELLSAWMGARSLAEVASVFDSAGVSWERYQTLADFAASDRRATTENPMMSVVDQPGLGSLLAAGAVLTGAARHRRHAEPAPRLGDDTVQVLRAVLQLPDEQCQRLVSEGVLGVSS